MISKMFTFFRGYHIVEHGFVFRAMSPWSFLGIPVLALVPLLIREINIESERIHAPDWVMWIVVAVLATGGGRRPSLQVLSDRPAHRKVPGLPRSALHPDGEQGGKP